MRRAGMTATTAKRHQPPVEEYEADKDMSGAWMIATKLIMDRRPSGIAKIATTVRPGVRGDYRFRVWPQTVM